MYFNYAPLKLYNTYHGRLTLCHLCSLNIIYIAKLPKFLSANQTQVLRKSFHSKPYLEKKELHQLAGLLNVSEGKIRMWYGKKRYKSRLAGLPFNGEEC